MAQHHAIEPSTGPSLQPALLAGRLRLPAWPPAPDWSGDWTYDVPGTRADRLGGLAEADEPFDEGGGPDRRDTRRSPADTAGRPGSPTEIPTRTSDPAAGYRAYLADLVNPGAPTPVGRAYARPDPRTGCPVSFDDRARDSGMMFAFKGPGLDRLLADRRTRTVVSVRLVDQAVRQVRALGGRSLVWIVAEEQSALYLKSLFEMVGLREIRVANVRWLYRA